MAAAAGSRQQTVSLNSPYTVKPLLQNVALTDGSKPETAISCVEYWEGNLYIGTFAGELLHYVSLPPENPSEEATFILASRLEPTAAPPAGFAATGVRKIIILPRSRKACVLCNNVITFHSLPELSPGVGNTKISKCQWVGGLDLNVEDDYDAPEDYVIIALAEVMRVVRIGDAAKGHSKISFPKCLAGARRGRFACVSDEHQYSLLDIENQQKIPLFLISTLDTKQVTTAVESLAPEQGHQRNRSAGSQGRMGSPAGHSRQGSLGDSLMARLRQTQARPGSSGKAEGELLMDTGSGTGTPQITTPSAEQNEQRAVSPNPAGFEDKALPDPPKIETPEAEQPTPELLVPHILSPNSNEFFLTTGTSMADAGVGMFVDLEGEIAPRGTVEFGRYPTSVSVDNLQDTAGTGMVTNVGEEGFILAAFSKSDDDGWVAGIEVQRWDTPGAESSWLELLDSRKDEGSTFDNKQPRIGVTSAFSSQTTALRDVSKRLKPSKLQLAGPDNEVAQVPPSPLTDEGDNQFWTRLDQRVSQTICWHDDQVSLLVRTPLLLQMEAALEAILASSHMQQDQLLQLVGQIQNREAASEAEYLSLAYLRQKISLIAYEDLATGRLSISPQISEKLLIDSDLDPRVIISTIPQLRQDIDEGARGIRLADGLISTVTSRLSGLAISLEPDEVLARPDDYDVTGMIKRYLSAWRQRKGFGSIPDEAHVFASIDAALLHLLLQYDQQSTLGPGRSTTLRAELYSMVDHGVSCPERAIKLLEEYKRLYVLSRLYGGRRAYGKVLETWRRMMDGEGDPAGEFQDRENLMRGYLVPLKDAALVERYGAYLAGINPVLGVQVFTDDSSRVKFEPNQVVEILQEQAPAAVKVYLEHLVFGKKNFRYANELISYYLTSVLDALEDSKNTNAKDMLEQSYEIYRALGAPKPTYRHFIAENQPRASSQNNSGQKLDSATGEHAWWGDRLRLLELLGGTFGSEFHYDVATILERVQPYDRYLVPESIILVGRQGHHQRALHLLTHGLGDFHTAINYCLLGGASIFHPAMATAAGVTLPDREEQRTLFSALLHDFLHLEDESLQREQVGELLARFDNWFEIEDVLPLIPEDWPLGTIEGFLAGAIRRLVQERAETMIVKALSGAENIIVASEYAEKSHGGTAVVVNGEEQAA